MATSAYAYKSNDTLVMLANQFNTDVSTLVRLNTWLRDPNTGKTHVDPNTSTTSQQLNLTETTSLAFEFTVKPKLGTVKARAVTSDGKLINYYEVNSKLISNNDLELGYVNYDSMSFVLTDVPINFKSILLIYDQDYWPTHIVLPLISNGSSSMEDYWEQMTESTGIQYNEMLANHNASQISYTKASSVDDLDIEYSNSDDNAPNIYSDVSLTDLNYGSMSNLGRLSTMFIVDDINAGLDMAKEALINNGGESGLFDTGYLDYASNSPKHGAVDFAINDLKSKINSSIGNAVVNSIGCKKLKHKVLKFDAYSNIKMIIQVGDNLIYLPVVPDSISDSASASYSSTSPLGSSEPYTIYNNTSARELNFQITLHRDMASGNSDTILEEIAGILQSGVYPSYSQSEVAAINTKVRVLNQVYISGIMKDVSVEFSGPIRANTSDSGSSDWMTGKYNILTISFKVQEVNSIPKGASEVVNRWTKLGAPKDFNGKNKKGLTIN